MNAKRLLSHLLVLTGLLALAACMTPGDDATPEAETPQIPDTPTAETPEETPESETPAAEEPSEEAQELSGTAWNLESLGPAGSETEVMEETTIVLSFDSAQELGGTGGCNSYGAGYTVEDGMLVLGELVTTLIACDDQAVMDQELRYYEALRAAGEYELSEDELTIWYEDGESALHFTRAG